MYVTNSMGSEVTYVRALFLAFGAKSSGMTGLTVVQVSHYADGFYISGGCP